MNNYNCVSQQSLRNNIGACQFNGGMSVDEFKILRETNFQFNVTDYSYSGQTILGEAVSFNNVLLVKYIVQEYGKKVFQFHDESKQVPLCYAKNSQMAQMLIDLDANVNINTYCIKGEIPPLRKAVLRCLDGKPNLDSLCVVRCLLKNNASSECLEEKYILGSYKKETSLKCKKIILLAMNEEIIKCAILALALNDNDSFFSIIGFHKEIISLIFKQIVRS